MFAAIIPHPSAWFPLNGTYKTREIEARTTSGSKGNEVYLSLGPDGRRHGSYFFRGSQASDITFSVSKLDIGVPITILCWLYTHDNNTETEGFLQYKGINLSVNHKELKLTFPKPSSSTSDDQFLIGTLAEKGWTFVGVSYNETTGEAKLWMDGNVVNWKTFTANFDSNGSQLLTLGGNNFKGKITQLMLFNLTLSQEQIQGIKGRMKLPGETESYIYLLKMIIFRYFKTYVILKDVCMASTFLSLYIISNTFIRYSYRFETCRSSHVSSIIPFIYLTSHIRIFFAKHIQSLDCLSNLRKANILEKIK